MIHDSPKTIGLEIRANRLLQLDRQSIRTLFVFLGQCGWHSMQTKVKRDRFWLRRPPRIYSQVVHTDSLPVQSTPDPGAYTLVTAIVPHIPAIPHGKDTAFFCYLGSSAFWAICAAPFLTQGFLLLLLSSKGI